MSGDLRAAVEGLFHRDPQNSGYVPSYSYGYNEGIAAVLALIPEGAVLVIYGEHGENDARHHFDLRCTVCGEQGSVTVVIEPQYVLRHLREGT